MTFQKAVGAIPAILRSGPLGWEAFQKAIGALPVKVSARSTPLQHHPTWVSVMRFGIVGELDNLIATRRAIIVGVFATIGVVTAIIALISISSVELYQSLYF